MSSGLERSGGRCLSAPAGVLINRTRFALQPHSRLPCFFVLFGKGKGKPQRSPAALT